MTARWNSRAFFITAVLLPTAAAKKLVRCTERSTFFQAIHSESGTSNAQTRVSDESVIPLSYFRRCVVGSAVVYLTCPKAKLDRMFDTQGMVVNRSTTSA